MLSNKAKSSDTLGASVIGGGAIKNNVAGGGVFTVQCFDKDGNLKWEEKNHNTVVSQGLSDMNNKYFTGASYTAAWYIGLVTGPGSGNTYSASDTLASHAGWSENTSYSGNRKSAYFGSATVADPSVIGNAGAPAAFSITGTTTLAGAFLCSVSTGTSGTLFSVSNFQAPGDRSVTSGDTINVTYTFSLDGV